MDIIDKQLPQLLDHARVVLGHYPTPLEHAPRLGADIGVDLYVKRDDCTGLAGGGNKVRQLEYYFGQAKVMQADAVLITGAIQSNFVRLCAAAANCLGMEAHVQLEQRVANMGKHYHQSGNVLLDRLLGAHISYFEQGEDEALADEALDHKALALRAEGRSPYVIHLGIQYSPLGALGYIRCAAELIGQMSQQRLYFDAVVTPSGSGLTHVGLLAGLRALGQYMPVHGICVRRDAAAQQARIRRRLKEVIALCGIDLDADEIEIMLSDAVLGDSYGQLNQQTGLAIRRAACLQGLLLDPVYSGKTLAGLIALVEQGSIAKGSRVLLLHSGGWPGLFAYQQALQPYLN